MSNSEEYSLPLLPPGLWCVVQLVRLVGLDDIAVVDQPSPPADQWDGGVAAAAHQRHGASAGSNPVASSSTDEGHFPVLLHPHIVDGVVVGGVGPHAAPADGRRVAA